MRQVVILGYGRLTGRAAAAHSASLTAQPRSAAAVEQARAEVDDLLAADGPENVRALQRAIRDTMTEHTGVVRDEDGLRTGLAELEEIEKRMESVGVHPDIAGYQDLAHAFDLKSAALGSVFKVASSARRAGLAGSGACDRKAEEGATAVGAPPVPLGTGGHWRLTTTRRACVPGHGRQTGL